MFRNTAQASNFVNITNSTCHYEVYIYRSINFGILVE